MTGYLGVVIEMIVVGLMSVTIGYCVLLDRRLKAVRQDEQAMRKTVTELSVATERAERAIESLRHTLGDCDRTLGERLRVAERYTADLEDQIRSGDEVLARISQIVATNAEPLEARRAPAGAEDPLAAFQARMASSAPAASRPASRIGQTLAVAHALAAQANAKAQDIQTRDDAQTRGHVA